MDFASQATNGHSGGVKTRSHILCVVTVAAGLLGGCDGETKRSNPNNFVCFWTVINPKPEQIAKIEAVVRGYPERARPLRAYRSSRVTSEWPQSAFI
jgi:hypothetical protein